MKKIIFRSYNRRGSAVNRGEDISNRLKINGYSSDYIVAAYNSVDVLNYWKKTYNSIIIFIKTHTVEEVEILKSNNNIVILDIVDSVANSVYGINDIVQFCWDGVITPTVEMKNLINTINKNINSTFIPHHWDKKHLVYKDNYEKNSFRLAYIGSLGHDGGLFYEKTIPNLHIVNDWSEQTKKSAYYTCHYSVRPHNSLQFLYKPNTKISTAAAVESNIIHSYDLSALNLVPNDYPYFTNSNINDICNTVDYARQTYGGSVWKYGLDIMASLKERTSIENVVDVDYINFLKTF